MTVIRAQIGVLMVAMFAAFFLVAGLFLAATAQARPEIDTDLPIAVKTPK